MADNKEPAQRRGQAGRTTSSLLVFVAAVLIVVGLLAHLPALTWIGVALFVVAAVLTVLQAVGNAREGQRRRSGS